MKSSNSSIINMAIRSFARLPGVGERSAQRIVLNLILQRETLLPNLLTQLDLLQQEIKTCEHCHNVDECSPCQICQDPSRNKKLLCVVEDVASLWALEKSGAYKGGYFVLGGALQAHKSEEFEQVKLPTLLALIQTNQVTEVILANSLTVEGQATSLYLKEEITQLGHNTKISTLAQGVPVGGEIDYLDKLTLQTAINLRRSF